MKNSLLLLALTAALAASCSTKVTYEDPEQIETINSDFGYSDLENIAAEMTQSFLGSGAWGGEKPRIVFGGVQNRTEQHLDTVNITDTIRTALLQSGKFRVLAGDQGIAELSKETDYQTSGAVDQEMAVKMGAQLGAEYVFYGRFTEIRKSAGDTKSSFLKFTMNAVNVQTRELVWADEARISKREEKSLFGW
ncbi:MAG: penicillin-binding protein activator LpoB [Planctomycetes bacterium]|jgi:hypothetical protein|nr:penicillin-binding protein activator LpoB [Planctomycetota bacterium]MBT4029803.1 penicillin-binding protein activator LpoB [Planctomycetota bacterium]MBT4559897.1 penicillin-binding protein activator LpoB [Planctomycetota bacterium]MBT5102022.1 penicillin-binding protein activator LpoB [Planctomycetota bacterium]MBT5120181.1 penicillin-binding protein activator LpoB [Planctomycetota bacterium]